MGRCPAGLPGNLFGLGGRFFRLPGNLCGSGGGRRGLGACGTGEEGRGGKFGGDRAGEAAKQGGEGSLV